ncbi:MAG: PPC domain-containing DNA-binding protein [Hyphomicrobiaceae bacterium]
MKSRLLNESNGLRTFVLVLENGDEIMSCIERFVADQSVSAAQFSAIGAMQSTVLGYFDWAKRDYNKHRREEQVEVASLTGDVAIGPDGKPAIHVHTVLGRHDGTALAGHLFEGHVRPTLEIVLTDAPSHLRKRVDKSSGLALIDPEV